MILIYLLLFIFFLLSSLGLGWFVISFLNLGKSERLVSACTLSILIWTFCAYIFGYAQVRFLCFVLAFLGLVLFVKFWKSISNNFKNLGALLFSDRLLLCIVCTGIFLQLLAIVGSGIPNLNGDRVYHRLQSSDGLFHISLAQSIKDSFPPQQPGAYGLPITNYHYWSNLYIGELSRVFLIPVDLLFFQFIPPLIAVLLVANLLLLGLNLGATKSVYRWLAFFHFFAGNATFFFTLILHQTFAWHTPAIDHGMIQFYNPPQTFAKLMFLFGSWVWIKYIKQRQTRLLVVVSLVFASLFGLKIYFGIYAALMLGLWHGFEWIRQRANLRKLWSELLCLILFGIVALIIFLPPNKQAGGLFFAPFAWPKILLGQQNIDWNEWWLRLQVYEHYQNQKAVVVMYTLAAIVFLVSIGGSRLLGLVSIPMLLGNGITKQWWRINWLITVLFFVIGMNFLQISGGANVFNFFIVALIIWGVMSAFTLNWLISHIPKAFKIIIALVLVTSLPRPINEIQLLVRSFINSEGSFVVTRQEFDALQYLKSLPGKTYQSHPEDRQDFHEAAYRAYFSQKYSYLAGAGILDSHNQPIRDRRLNIQRLFSASTAADFATQMSDLGIDYVFLNPKNEKLLLFTIQSGLENNTLNELYRNESAVIIAPGK